MWQLAQHLPPEPEPTAPNLIVQFYGNPTKNLVPGACVLTVPRKPRRAVKGKLFRSFRVTSTILTEANGRKVNRMDHLDGVEMLPISLLTFVGVT